MRNNHVKLYSFSLFFAALSLIGLFKQNNLAFIEEHATQFDFKSILEERVESKIESTDEKTVLKSTDTIPAEAPEETQIVTPPINTASSTVRVKLKEYDERAEAALNQVGTSAEKLRNFLDNCSPQNVMLPNGMLGMNYYHGYNDIESFLGSFASQFGYGEWSLTYKKPDISVYYCNLVTGYEFGYNENEIRDSASLAKIPYLLSVLKEIQTFEDNNRSEDGLIKYSDASKKYDLDETWTYDGATMFRPGSGVLFEEQSGVQYPWKDLFSFAFRNSDNIAYAQLKGRFGFSSYFKLLGELGIYLTMNDERFLSARDYGKIMKNAYAFMTSDTKYGQFMRNEMAEAAQNNIIGSCYPHGMVSHKYGWDLRAYHDCAVVFDEEPYVIVIMTDYDIGGDPADRFIKDVVGMIKELHLNRGG